MSKLANVEDKDGQLQKSNVCVCTLLHGNIPWISSLFCVPSIDGCFAVALNDIIACSQAYYSFAHVFPSFGQ